MGNVGVYSSAEQWQSYTPTIGVSGGTYAGSATTAARFKIKEKTCSIFIDVNSGTTASTPNYLTFTLPVTPKRVRVPFYGWRAEAGNPLGAVFVWFSGSSHVRVYPHDGTASAWGDNAGSGFFASGEYEIA